jgi:hypothetical protein
VRSAAPRYCKIDVIAEIRFDLLERNMGRHLQIIDNATDRPLIVVGSKTSTRMGNGAIEFSASHVAASWS